MITNVNIDMEKGKYFSLLVGVQTGVVTIEIPVEVLRKTTTTT